jgi:hypothetical protein
MEQVCVTRDRSLESISAVALVSFCKLGGGGLLTGWAQWRATNDQRDRGCSCSCRTVELGNDADVTSEVVARSQYAVTCRHYRVLIKPRQ